MIYRKLTITLATGACLMAGTLPGVAADTIKFGVVGALTGGAAQWGLAVREAVRIAADEVNAKGGLDVGGKKYKVEMVAYDDQQKAADALSAYNRLVNVDGGKYVFLQSSASTLAIKPRAESDEVVLMSAAFSPKIIDDATKYTFRIYLNADNYVPALISWMKNNLKERRVASLNPNDETGWGQAEVTAKFYKQNGFEQLAGELYERSQKDFQPVLTKIMALNPEIIDLGTSAPATGGIIIRQARELGYKGRIIQTGGPGWDAIVAAAGKEAVEGMICIVYADPQDKGYRKIADDYKKAMGQDPNELILPVYDSAQVLLKAIQLAGDPADTKKVAAAFAKVLPTKSLQGDDLTFGRQQIMTVDYVAEMKDGKPSMIGKLN